MKILKRTGVLFAALSLAFSGDESRIGTSGGNQLLVPVGARGIAMAGSERVYSSGLESVYWNPAGLARTRETQVLATSMDLFNDIGVIYFGASASLGDLGSVGLTV